MSTTTKKITLATLKRFVEANRGRLLIRCAQFRAAQPTDADRVCKNNLGIAGLWLVLGSRDYFSPHAGDGLVGIRCYNCCGTWTVAIAREEVGI